jgi:multisubunit Na+/H+ antiporter MnhE subunit
MRRLLALAMLGINFLKEVVVSGWVTARIILAGPRGLRPGFVRLAYGDLPEGAASLLAALVTLTPGTTVVDIDPERREFLMHLLDLDQAEATLAAIRRDFLAPIRALVGVEP